jgi:hypothetical protein
MRLVRTRLVRLSITTVIGLGGIWLVAGETRQKAFGTSEVSEGRAAGPVPHLLGAASCAASACHNGGGIAGQKRSEYATWAARDPHSRAFDALQTDRSQAIERIRAVAHRGADTLLADQDAFCLKCHSPAALEPTARRVAASDGVACESCHGPASLWLTRHYAEDWNGLSSADRGALGFRDTKPLLTRIKSCIPCHVGSSEASIDHDLLAAGHPALRFEFSAYHAVMPRHWSDRADKERTPDFELRGWMAGQAASAAASMNLLAHRAARFGDAEAGQRRSSWLDFADYDCFACHHNLQNNVAARFQPAGNNPLQVKLPANTWYTAVLNQALIAGGLDHSRLDVERLNGAISSAVAKPPDIVSMAAAVSSELNSDVTVLASASPLSRVQRKLLMDGLCKNGDRSWDGMAQRYLALAATYHTDNDLGTAMPELRPLITDIGRQVHFPRSDSVVYDSPDALQEVLRIAEFKKDIEMIRARLHRDGQ